MGHLVIQGEVKGCMRGRAVTPYARYSCISVLGLVTQIHIDQSGLCHVETY